MNIDRKLIQKGLKTDFMGRKILILDKTGSTNLEVKKMARNKEQDGTLIIAEEQSKGKGQLGRSWFSSKGESISMSLLVYADEIRNEILPTLSLAVGLAVSEALESVTKKKFDLKWPNDILVNGMKVCGILCEKFIALERKFVVVGIGINVNNREFPEDLKNTATSLFIVGGRLFSREMIISSILNKFEQIYYKFYKNEIKNIIDKYKSRCISIGKNIEFVKNGTNDKTKNTGTISDISCLGEIIVIDKNGDKTYLNSSQSILKSVIF